MSVLLDDSGDVVMESAGVGGGGGVSPRRDQKS